LLTDDRDRTRRYFAPDVEYGFFESTEVLPAVIERWLGNEAERVSGARSAQRTAEQIAVTDFWTQIDVGLRQRGLPSASISVR